MALILQKYYKLFCFFTICSIFCSSCGFPYNTRQARQARKTKRIAQKQAKKQAKKGKLNPIDTVLNTTVDPFIQLDSTAITTSNPLVDSSSVVADSPVSDSTQPSIITLVKSDTIGLDSIANLMHTDSLIQDSTQLLVASDSMITDSLNGDAAINESMERTIQYSTDSLDLPVQYESADSMIYDLAERKVYLYNNAEVFYEQYNLKAGYIEFDFITNVATATCLLDSAGNEIQCPFFDDKTQKFTCRRIEFNFKTKKGKVYDASTQQGDGYLVSNATKFISQGGDSTTDNSQNILYSQGCLYTTCDAGHPHFGIRASKAKIIPGKLIVVGPSFLEIMGSPTPILLPFGFFPITKNKRSGLILSMDLDFSPRLGPGIREIGFYLGLSEYWDLKVTGDFYMRGSLRARAQSQYNIRYKGKGSVELGYTRLQVDEKGTPDYNLEQSFNLKWTHTQAPQAHPSQSFSATINFGTSDYYKNTFNDANSVLATTFNSNVSYNKRFLGTPFSLSARLSHSQNTKTHAMTITFPQLGLNMNQVFPFKRKNVSGKQRWYERIGFSYGLNASNTITTTDTAIFKVGGLEEAIQNMNYSVTHSPRLNFSFKLFKVINVQPSVNYTQQWFFYRNRQYLDPTPVVNPENPSDTTSFGTIEKYKEYGFYTTHRFSSGVNINTQIYATGNFNIGALKQVRAVFSPNIGFSWTPSYENAYDYFYDSVQYDTRYPDQLRRYNYFAFSPPSGKTALLTYSLGSRFEAKVKKGKRDSTIKEAYKKIVLIPTATISGNYNIAADSLHLSPINFNTSTTLFKKINVRFSATFDPYAANPENNSRLNTFEFNFSQGKRLVRVTSMSFNASTGINSKDLRNLFRKKGVKEDKNKKQFDLIRNINIGYNLIVQNRYIDGVDSTLVTANQLSFSGSINLSKGWAIRIGNIGYSFKDERITFPDFTFSRDLHCWQMGLSWQPERQTWNFFIRVKPGSLGFLEVPVKREFYEVF
ncbi:putative LPS assembly protein LptD [Aureispira anguillae]|uniref:LPS-assembly protein LptD n=1 Tax=Aureispira anguillae TaxID=2864201 RepID=A0A916DV11_9BACT|nr:putative LPS assembly protein LptD [Aureispira anguillae]BDS13242.1 LPS-assembly protein LptD [Aureispira anguillae]